MIDLKGSILTMRVGIIGATGAVGQELLQVLEKRHFPLTELRCFASERSVGKCASFRGEKLPIEVLTEVSFRNLDIAIFSAGRKIAEQFAPIAVRSGALVIDNSSAFRKDEKVPLIIPEINVHALKGHQGIIASPNCTTTIMLMVLGPLHRAARIRRIVAATYQAASGAGALAMRELELETNAHLENRPFERTIFPFPYAFNLFSHNSPLSANGYNDEELKMIHETHKILEDATIQISATCIRVPILRAHAEALTVDFHTSLSKETASQLLSSSPGVTLLDHWAENRFPMPSDATGQDNVFCGRIREDLFQANTLHLWVVGDQLLKGAALNAVQIAETLCL